MTVYLDTSSLVKLFLEEAGSAEVRAVTATATIATSVVAYAETRATLARRRREGMLTPRTFAAAKRAFETAWQSYARIEVTADVARQAGDFAERFALRGFDTIHLASFASLAGGGAVMFSSFDADLNRAADSWIRPARRSSVSRRRARS